MQQRITAGGMLDLLTKDELDLAMGHHFDSAIRELYRGIAYIRLPLLQGAASGGTLTLGQGGTLNSPRQGYAWSVKRLAVNGLATGTTPDVVNLYRGDLMAYPVWQFNGNNFAYTFGKLELVLLPGENLVLSGTITATGTITLSGDAIEVPQEMIGKLV